MSLLVPNQNYSNIEILNKVVSLVKNGFLPDNAIIKRGFVAAPLPVPPTTFQNLTGVIDSNFADDEIAFCYIRADVTTYNSGNDLYTIVDSVGNKWYAMMPTSPLILTKLEWNNFNYQGQQLWSNVFIEYFTVRLTQISI